MSYKSGKLDILVFTAILVLPLLGLAIMDYQLKVANDITGAYSLDSSSYESTLAGAVIVGVIVFTVAVFTYNRIRKAKVVSTMPHSAIDAEIQKINENLKR